jgi:hypothetical protein
MTLEEYRVSDEVLAQLQETCMDRAVKRLEVNVINNEYLRCYKQAHYSLKI